MVLSGEITEIVGSLGSGRTSLLTFCLRDTTRRGAIAALVDTDQAFDPASAARAGVDLRRLLWVRCSGRRVAALRAADLLVRCPGFALVGLDLGETPPRLPLTLAFRLRLAARRTGTALVILAGRRIAGPGASLALRTTRRALEWTGPASVPTRLARMGTTVQVVRRRGGLHALTVPDATWWWTA
ncbi:MAG: hypothetical protein AUH29_11750 [Candidatus Rokubacteria bacterium 13_1_40CM_69_27]|nr:MAG: hypothetical protein AUH29_11750 [Candidatus Rokubacteria bacterium 13_1_40CM_69_27]OLC39718.1 MAG: hypothetical protein AUH81_00910 [Candidatus Rokubacteria bacterium 13_1_40CM_4_69_5]OLE39295.1 MAG: hypothetical protein AUG00_02710 [Candidatus Rokubacteria bacterium 13_1_20CM_2_70_7]